MLETISDLPPPPERARRILVVDDDEDRCRMLQKLLGREGYDVDTLGDGMDVIEHVQQNPPDLVLLDVMLPGVSGFELCADLKMVEEMKLTPIILITSQIVDEESVVRGLMCGADDYVVTPSRLAELRARIRVQLRNRRERELLEWVRAQRATFKSAAYADALTGVANRRHVDQVIDEILSTSESVVVLLADLDHFKAVNDTFGHAAGDRVLKEVAATLEAKARTGDLVGRYGGEEFVVIVRGAKRDAARAIGERYLNAVRAIQFGPSDGPERITISIGVAWDDGVDGPRATREQLLAAADAALYVAKNNGRDRIELASEITMTSNEERNAS